MEPQRLIRTYRDGDEEGIFELFRAVYPSEQHNRERWMRWWRWMYRENPAGPANIYIVEEQGKIVAHLGYVPVYLKVGEQITKAYQATNFMIHPDYKSKGQWMLERRLLPGSDQDI